MIPGGLSNLVLTPGQRVTFGRAANLISPRQDPMPSATEAGVAQSGIDDVLAARPDLAGPLAGILTALDQPGAGFEDVASADRDGFAALLLAALAAYYMQPSVRSLLCYPGQQSVRPPSDPNADMELLAPVLNRGRRYRDESQTLQGGNPDAR